MGLATNVTRRGGVYWWRGRIGPGRQPSRVIARSLRTRDPETARALGTQITGLAAQLRQRVRCGIMSTEQAEIEIDVFFARFPFEFDPKVLVRLDAMPTKPADRASECLDFSAAQQRAMLADFARRMGPILERRAADIRTRPPLVLDGIATDWVAEAIRNGRVQAEACRLLALSGTSARVRDEDCAALLAAGFCAEEIGEIDAVARRHAPGEAGSDWRIGPERKVLEFHLQAVGAVATAENVGRLRHATLLVLADLLRAHVRRYQSVPDHYAAIIATASESGAKSTEPAEHLDPDPSAPQTVSASAAESPSATSRPAAAPASFLAMVETLVRSKTQEKSREWDDKTARQHLSIAKLFVKNAKTDEPALMTQHHVGSYLDLLRIIPTHYGKSSADEGRTLDEILARSEDLDEDEIGLKPPTINRHRSELGTILKYMRRNGFNIGLIDEDSHVKDSTSPEEKRRAFTSDDGVRLMITIDQLSQQPGYVDSDALFWVPNLGWYEMMRLGEAAGLAPDDIDLTTGLIHIRSNALRRVKTKSSIRDIPVHPELARLGFCNLVARRQADGSRQLFPGLFGGKSEFGAVFQKMWAPVLDLALPTARESRMTLHSMRKTGNSAMHTPNVMTNTRLYIMGHAKLDVNGKHYLTLPSQGDMLQALNYIPIVTAGLSPRT